MAVARRLLSILAVALFCAFLGHGAQALDDAQLKAADAAANDLQAQIDRVTGELAAPDPTADFLAAKRSELDQVRVKAQAKADEIGGPLGDITKQVTELGAPPADGQTEPEAIASQRKALADQQNSLTAAQKRFVLLALGAEQAQARVTDLQRQQFLQRIFKSEHSVLDPRLWVDTFNGSVQLWGEFLDITGRAFGNKPGTFKPAAMLIFPVGMAFFWLLGFVVLPQILRRAGLIPRDSGDPSTESGLRRLWRVTWGFFKLFVITAASFLLLSLSFEASGIATAELSSIVNSIIVSLFQGVLQGGVVYLVTAPFHPERRLVAIDNKSARNLSLIVFFAGIAYGLGDEISQIATSASLPVSFTVGQSAITAIVLIILLGFGLNIVRRQALAGPENASASYFLVWFVNCMPVLWGLLIVAALALVFGFISLAYFIAGNLLDTALLLILFGVLHAFADALSKSLLQPDSRPGLVLRRFTQWSETTISRVVLTLRTIADALLVLLALMSLIALWTVVLFDFDTALSALSQGVRVGGISISPGALALAALVLIIGVFSTRFFIRWLDQRVLAETHFDRGVQNSLRAAASYGGYTLAIALALSTAGVDFSNLAIVAGALGLGLGFGLQSIANNFVSGLILLAERPVRVGDWVVTGAGEGIVKKINVRSTEIETFDHCSIIVPNSNLIIEPVRNWTHGDQIGRFTVHVSFSHGTDAEKVAAKLMKIAQDHPKVMRHPPPVVQLVQITGQSMDFALRAHIGDVFEGGIAASEIRIAITKAFTRKELLIAPGTPATGRT